MLLLFDNLIHENGLVHSLRRVQTRRPLAISLDLVLVTHGNRTKEQDDSQVSLTDAGNCFVSLAFLNLTLVLTLGRGCCKSGLDQLRGFLSCR